VAVEIPARRLVARVAERIEVAEDIVVPSRRGGIESGERK